MTSEERRAARRFRRAERRQRKKRELYGDCDDFNKVFTYKHLYHAYRKARRGTTWKGSVQRFSMLAPLNVQALKQKLRRGTYKSPGFREFDTYERGVKRHIKSVVISERVVQRCLCDYALVPILSQSFIYDNGASMKGKGYSFAINRITAKLRQHYRKHGNEGYILLYDFSKFFDRVSHELVKRIVHDSFKDARLIQLAVHFIDMFGSIGLGLGSQISQVLALTSANTLDHSVKELMRIRDYIRYMDDGAIISISKARLVQCLRLMRWICKKLRIRLNSKKTQIVKLSHGFTWLKVRFYLTSKGRVVRKIYKWSITKQRHRMKKLFIRYAEGAIPFETVRHSFESWRAYAKSFHAKQTIRNMLKFFNRLTEVYGGEKIICFTSKSQMCRMALS